MIPAIDPAQFCRFAPAGGPNVGPPILPPVGLAAWVAAVQAEGAKAQDGAAEKDAPASEG